MKLVIDIDEEEYTGIKNAINSLIKNGVERASMSKICLAILDGVQLPKEATNGDMIKAMFPNVYVEECDYDIFTTLDGETRFTYDWWNAPLGTLCVED
jgi:hypothetical protein